MAFGSVTIVFFVASRASLAVSVHARPMNVREPPKYNVTWYEKWVLPGRFCGCSDRVKACMVRKVGVAATVSRLFGWTERQQPKAAQLESKGATCEPEPA